VLFSLKKAGLVFGVNVITELNLTLVGGKFNGFLLIDGMCTFQNSIPHLQHHKNQVSATLGLRRLSIFTNSCCVIVYTYSNPNAMK